VDFSEWIERDAECICVLFLSDRERYTILSHLWPYAEWRTRVVTPGANEWWLTVADADYNLFKDELDQLIVKLTGGDGMACNQTLADALNNIATALRTSGGGGGGGCGSGGGAILNCYSGFTDDQITDAAPPPTDPYGSTPPEGFDTMEEYLTYKCQAANAVLDGLKNLFNSLQGLGLTQLVGPVLIGWLAGVLGVLGPAIALPPATVAILIGAILASAALGISIFIVSHTVAEYLETNRADIVCQLYQSGNAAAAISVLSSALDDALQTVAWAEVFGPLAEQAAAAFGSVAAALQSNGLVDSLFRLTADVAYPGADCDGCLTPGLEWHFTLGPEGWVFEDLSSNGATGTGNWSDAAPIDPGDVSAGHLAVQQHAVEGGVPQPEWVRYFSDPKPVATVSTVFRADVYQGMEQGGQNSAIYIVYEDDTYDFDYTQDDAGWWTLTANANPGNAGKEIDHIIYLTNLWGGPYFSNTGAVDNASLTGTV